MAEQHPIAPTPEMVREWAIAEWPYCSKDDELEKFWTRLATRAAQWGAAAALCAAADQVVPEEPPHPHANSPEAERFGTPEDWAYAGIERDARQEARAKFLAIAAELALPPPHR
jgi:hypothetical protein